MPHLSRLRNAWRNLFRRDRVEQDLDEEVRAHLDLLTDEKMRAGMSPAQARRAAGLELGGIEQVKEEVRDARAGAWLSSFWQDLRYGARMLRQSPGFAAVAVLAVAVGVGVNAGIFSILNGAALRPLDVPGAADLVSVYQSFAGRIHRNVHGEGSLFSHSEYKTYREQNRVFSGLMAYAPFVDASLGGEQPKQISGTLSSCNYFDLLGVRPAMGRGFVESECAAPGARAVVVVSDHLWRSEFGSDPAILGKLIHLNRTSFTVVGVAPPGFSGSEIIPSEFWAPLTSAPTLLAVQDEDMLNDPDLSWLVLVGRIAPGISREQIRANLALITAQIDQHRPGTKTTIILGGVSRLATPEEHKIAMGVGAVILVAVGLISLVACANVANLLLARAKVRRREIAVRLALGASRRRLIRQLLTESLLIAILGGALGSLLAFISSGTVVRLVVASLPAGAPAVVINSGPDLRVLGYALAITIVTGIGFGLAPALESSRVDLNTALKEEGSEYEGKTGGIGFMRKALVAGQVTVCMVLLIAAGLLIHGLYVAQTVNPGFDMNNVTAISYDLSSGGCDQQKAAAFQSNLQERLAGLPGVEGVAQALAIPLGGEFHGTSVLLPEEKRELPIHFNYVSANYFSLLRLPIVRGRGFTDVEARAGAKVTIVTESTARRFWPSQDPIGKTLKVERAGNFAVEVVGVVKDAQVGNLGRSNETYLYFPSDPKQQLGMRVLVRGANSFAPGTEDIRATIRALDPELPARIVRMEDNLENWRAPSRIVAALSATLGVLALLLASVGVYGMVSYAISRRIREIGIRIALGADRGDVMKLLLRQAVRPVMIGALVGIAASAGVSRVLTALLFGISALDPVAFLLVPAFLLAVALFASYLPARRAMRVDPMVALRYE